MVLKAGNAETHELATAMTISAFFGVTEPTLYSFMLKYRKVLAASCPSGGAARAVRGTLGETKR